MPRPRARPTPSRCRGLVRASLDRRHRHGRRDRPRARSAASSAGQAPRRSGPCRPSLVSARGHRPGAATIAERGGAMATGTRVRRALGRRRRFSSRSATASRSTSRWPGRPIAVARSAVHPRPHLYPKWRSVDASPSVAINRAAGGRVPSRRPNDKVAAIIAARPRRSATGPPRLRALRGSGKESAPRFPAARVFAAEGGAPPNQGPRPRPRFGAQAAEHPARSLPSRRPVESPSTAATIRS